ncbi:sarcocystatin-A-like [Teleopsis dalmanni]|uniref:sarcocystatin-A-like n=1 Tax=Teleopsis dalmanni TaxID=139649 RepID=UPI000D32B038|nr:sarcocystatin-A-like [Teleopsis dalmanni]XP_037953273.1 sarcocystatin-A-like [Teleopsis dalmanni]XP_037954896.1 sarcocystatin-A-like [Teleopsis dalmanni]
MFNPKIVFAFFALFVAITYAKPNDLHVIGGPKNLQGDDLKDAENTLQNSLNKLAAGDGPNYKIEEIISASRQVVSGSLYKIKAKLVGNDSSTKVCDVKIWSQPWLENGIEVTFECDGEEKVVKKHSA